MPVLADETVFDDEAGCPDFRVSMLKCPGCKFPLLAKETYLGENEFGPAWDRSVRLWPNPNRERHPSIPPIVQVSLDEAHACHHAGAHTACAVMCGRALEGVCVHFAAGNYLQKGLQALRDKGLIDDRLFKWGNELRVQRNLAAHATPHKVSKEDATDLLEFVSAICEYIFVLAARFDAFMQRKTIPATNPKPDQPEPPLTPPAAPDDVPF